MEADFSQKFFRGQRVRIGDTPFTKKMREIDGIVYKTFQEDTGDTNLETAKTYFSVVRIDENEVPIEEIKWYHESEMTLFCDNRKKGIAIIRRLRPLTTW